MTNIVVLLLVNLYTNTSYSLHPSGQEKTRIDTVIEQHVIQYEWRGVTNLITNEVFFAEYKKRLVVDWKEAPLRPDVLYYPPIINKL